MTTGRLTQRAVGPPTLGLVDVIYLFPWVVATLILHDIKGIVSLLLVPLFAASWWQDWRSARAATTYYAGVMVGSDAITSANYAALADGWRRGFDPGMLLSSQTYFHWSAIFAIYIVWNLVLIRSGDQRTRKMFIWFSVAEAPLLVVSTLLSVASILHHPLFKWVVVVGIVFLAVGHVLLLVGWRLMSRSDSS